MRSAEEQFREIMRRAELKEGKRIIQKAVLGDAAAACICLILLVAAAVHLPSLTTARTGSTASRYGSLLIGAPYIGYVIVGLLAFALGVCVTMLCVHWKKTKERERK